MGTGDDSASLPACPYGCASHAISHSASEMHTCKEVPVQQASTIVAVIV